MTIFRPKLLIVILVIVLLITTAFIISKQLKPTQKLQPASTNISESTKKTVSASDKPTIISTKPDPLEENIVSVTDTVEITFNRPLENVGEFKSRLEPKIEYKVELSSDRKTAKIKPVKSFLLGTTYTLFIGPETKFDGVGRWGEEKIYHFKTITYRGV